MYALAVEGTTVNASAIELAENYLASAESRREAAESLVAYESLKACGSGFACGVAGDGLLPLTVTANVCSSLLIQMRMCAAIAVIVGYDMCYPRIRLLCWGARAMAGDSGMDVLNRIVLRLLSKSLALPDAQ